MHGAARKAWAQKNPKKCAANFFERQGFSLPVKIECLHHPGETLIRTWYVAPATWLSYLMEASPSLLAGAGDPGENFRMFWASFRAGHGHHEIFSSPLISCLDRTVPLVVHGDEGRTLKRGKCMVMSVQSVLGHVGKPASREICDCKETLAETNIPPIGIQGDAEDVYCFPACCHESLRRQVTNYRGHSFLTRWLLFTLPSWIYTKHPEVLQALLRRTADDIRKLFQEGFLVRGQRYFAATVVVKGDMDWHRQTYNLTRSYAFCGTYSTGKLCHLCGAGGGGPAAEDYRAEPAWANTFLRERPWDTHAAPPALTSIPAYLAPEEVLQPDPFHVVKFGIGRSIAGGVLVYLVRKTCFDYEGCSGLSFPERLNRAHSSFAMWCRAEKKHPALRSFTKQFLNMRNFASAPWTNCKGSDTGLLLQWLHWFLSLTLRDPPAACDRGLLRKMQQLCQSYRSIFRSVHFHNLWMERACGRRLYVEIMRLLRGYQVVGSLCLRSRFRAFLQKPKNHALAHTAFHIRQQLLAGAPYILNIEAYSCEQDEDFIGRVSRLSRKVDVRTQGKRVFTRIFLKFRALRKRSKGQS